MMTSIIKQTHELEIAQSDYNMALSSIAIWDMPYKDALGIQKVKEAISKRDAAKNKIDHIQAQLKSNIKDFYARIHEDKYKENDFIGWAVTQRYKCKTGDGHPAFGDDIFVFNKDITECLLHMTNEEFNVLCEFVNNLTSIPEEEFIERLDAVIEQS